MFDRRACWFTDHGRVGQIMVIKDWLTLLELIHRYTLYSNTSGLPVQVCPWCGYSHTWAWYGGSALMIPIWGTFNPIGYGPNTTD